MGAEAQSPGVSSASNVAVRGQRALQTKTFAPIEINFVVSNRFHVLNFTLQSAISEHPTVSLSLVPRMEQPSPEEAGDEGPTTLGERQR